jgi:hypothetical protein
MLVGLGLTQEQIGHVVDKSVDSLARHCRQELDAGRAEMIAKVAGNLVQKALSGDTTCAIFYLKTQAGWRETQNLDLTHDFKGLNVTIGRRPDN